MKTMFEVVVMFVVCVGAGYGFRGLINRFIKKAGADVTKEVDKVKADVKSKL